MTTHTFESDGTVVGIATHYVGDTGWKWDVSVWTLIFDPRIPTNTPDLHHQHRVEFATAKEATDAGRHMQRTALRRLHLDNDATGSVQFTVHPVPGTGEGGDDGRDRVIVQTDYLWETP